MIKTVNLEQIVCALVLSLALAVVAHAETFVRVENRTALTLTFRTTVEGGLGRDCWSPMATVVRPGESAAVLRFNRNSGITDGRFFHFNTAVSAGGGTLTLVQRLQGTTFHSQLWQTVRGDDFSDERAMRHFTWNLEPDPVPVSYQAVACGVGDDDVVYRFEAARPAPPATGPLRLLTYNVWMRPTSMFSDGQEQRAGLIPQHIADHDVVVLCEVFDDEARDQLMSGLAASYPFQTNVVGRDSGLGQDGGVVVVSRFPIGRTAQMIYQNRKGWDARSKKGVRYAEILRGGQRVHVFATHMQAEDDGDAVRTAQLGELAAFVKGRQIPADEPVLIAGDLNIAEDGPEWEGTLTALGATRPDRHGGPESNERTNPLATAPYGHLDHVLALEAHRHPRTFRPQSMVMADSRGWVKPGPAGMFLWQRHLSDHHAVAVELDLSGAPGAPADAPAAGTGGPAMSLLGVGGFGR